jgi:uncharacterized protein (DUF433 family)
MKTERKSSIDVYERERPFPHYNLLNRRLRERHADNARVYIIHRPVNQSLVKEQFRLLAKSLCEKHPAISTFERVLGGAPHIKGMRVSVANILTHLYHLGSVDAVVNEFRQNISREQVKEAIAYAHDFMEMTCDPPETVD